MRIKHDFNDVLWLSLGRPPFLLLNLFLLCGLKLAVIVALLP